MQRLPAPRRVRRPLLRPLPCSVDASETRRDPDLAEIEATLVRCERLVRSAVQRVEKEQQSYQELSDRLHGCAPLGQRLRRELEDRIQRVCERLARAQASHRELRTLLSGLNDEATRYSERRTGSA